MHSIDVNTDDLNHQLLHQGYCDIWGRKKKRINLTQQNSVIDANGQRKEIARVSLISCARTGTYSSATANVALSVSLAELSS